jgi:hypothetical protein
MNKVKNDGFPLSIANYGVGIGESGVESGDGGIARFEIGHSELITSKNINEDDDEIL